MTPTGPRRDEGERGVVLIIVAFTLVVLLGMIAIAIDGSYGFVQNRRAQNASDFAAFAAAQELDTSYYCSGLSTPSTRQIVKIVEDVVNANDLGLGNSWTAEFLDRSGNAIDIPNSSPPQAMTFKPGSTGIPPEGACGVKVTVTPRWTPFFAGVLGIHQLGGFASASVAPKNATGTPIGIVALNKVGPHEILGGGTGQFVVAGDIFLNTDVSHQPWSSPAKDTATGVWWTWDDAIDAKTNSNIYVYGTIHSNNGTDNGQSLWPLDTCFEPNVLGNGDPTSPSPLYQSGDPAAQSPGVQMSCSEHGGSVNIDFDNIDPTNNQISDPLGATLAPPNPLNPATDIACPGSTLATNPATTMDANGVKQYSPGEYTEPVEITGSANFNDCTGGYTGIYRFDQGLWINPQARRDTVRGTNVVLATENPYPVAGNVPGSMVNGAFKPTLDANGKDVGGNGAPCLPSTTTSSAASGNGTPTPETSGNVCAGTSPATNGVIGYADSTFVPDTTETGTGNNFSVIIGGVAGSSVTLTGPVSGAYGGTGGQPGLVLYQDPGTQANDGFDAGAGDAADVTLNGVVYNASLANYGTSAPLDYWDGPGGGIPFYAGGTLQAGFGAGWSNGPTESAGSVSINGTAIVDDFNTDGATTITIVGQPYSLPGNSFLSLIG